MYPFGGRTVTQITGQDGFLIKLDEAVSISKTNFNQNTSLKNRKIAPKLFSIKQNSAHLCVYLHLHALCLHMHCIGSCKRFINQFKRLRDLSSSICVTCHVFKCFSVRWMSETVCCVDLFIAPFCWYNFGVCRYFHFFLYIPILYISVNIFLTRILIAMQRLGNVH